MFHWRSFLREYNIDYDYSMTAQIPKNKTSNKKYLYTFD